PAQRHEPARSRGHCADTQDHQRPPGRSIPAAHKEGSWFQALGQAAPKAEDLESGQSTFLGKIVRGCNDAIIDIERAGKMPLATMIFLIFSASKLGCDRGALGLANKVQ